MYFVSVGSSGFFFSLYKKHIKYILGKKKTIYECTHKYMEGIQSLCSSQSEVDQGKHSEM